jgi:hypothetical protein
VSKNFFTPWGAALAGRDVREALKAPPSPSPVRTLADMSEAEKRALEAQYGVKVCRRG